MRKPWKLRWPKGVGTVEERFWMRVEKTDGCWNWRGARTRGDYGIFLPQHGGTPHRVHRYSYVLAGGTIPDGMLVCHHCDNRLCVRPDHLFVGTASDNMRDMHAKGRQRKNYTRRTHCHRGHERTAMVTGELYCRQCTVENARARRARLREMADGARSA